VRRAGSVMEYSTAKILAILGALLALLGSYGGMQILGLAGLVLYLVGMYGLADAYGNRDIFTYALIASVGAILFVVLMAMLIFGLVFAVGPAAGAGLGLGVLVLAYVVLVVAALIIGYYKKKLMEALAPHADSGLAGITGKLYWYGGLLSIIIIGFILIALAEILEIVVLATLREPTAMAQERAPAQPYLGP
jgi:uncharacterized membrane protein